MSRVSSLVMVRVAALVAFFTTRSLVDVRFLVVFPLTFSLTYVPNMAAKVEVTAVMTAAPAAAEASATAPPPLSPLRPADHGIAQEAAVVTTILRTGARGRRGIVDTPTDEDTIVRRLGTLLTARTLVDHHLEEGLAPLVRITVLVIALQTTVSITLSSLRVITSLPSVC